VLPVILIAYVRLRLTSTNPTSVIIPMENHCVTTLTWRHSLLLLTYEDKHPFGVSQSD